MSCVHCGGRLFQDKEDHDYWSCLLCGRSPQQELWRSQAETFAIADRAPVGRRKTTRDGVTHMRVNGVKIG